MNDPVLVPGKFYQVQFNDGQPIDFRFKGNDASNDSILCEKKGGETFYLDTVEPYEKIVEIQGW